ncbi:UDP-N-acetylmuramoylalanyl-D-glutamyl-2,6-diaminopimelate--D-alanyl-D-alanine ligase [Minicystis rosea]|nr:UDP-N-acetylmuramoylalanyl-D-glutamyl-2,6-diaminopimelate--D-alanyl-D-alanine ligase [Minicystis rosea]
MATPIPQNHAGFTLAEILDATGGSLAHGNVEEVTAVSTDTRAITEGACFVALRGEVHDGHAHLAAAREKGAALAIVDREVEAPAGLAIVRVPDTLVALGDLARAHTRRWRALGGRRAVVGITGSAGKTTTRVAVSALLEAIFPGEVHGTAGNLNNRVGVPMVLFGLEPKHHFAVVEMGMNLPGEIAELCRIAEPDAGVVTLVAAAHTEGLGSIEGVAHEKGALFRALREDGVAIGNGDDARVRAQIQSSPATRRCLYGRVEGAAVRIVDRVPVGMTSSRLTLERPSFGAITFETPLLGEAGALACAAAVAVAEVAMGAHVTDAICADAFARADVGAGAGRLVPRVFASGLAVIDDTYNANPASTCASIRAAAEIARATGRRLVLVLGEMKELGIESAPGHDEVGRAAAASGAAEVLTVGGGEAPRMAARAVEGGMRAAHAERVDDIIILVKLALRTNDLVLVKGSRSIGTERVVHALAADHDRAGGHSL